MQNSFGSVIEKSGQLSELLKLINEGGENAPHLLYDLAAEKCAEIAEFINEKRPEKESAYYTAGDNEEPNELSDQTENKDITLEDKPSEEIKITVTVEEQPEAEDEIIETEDTVKQPEEEVTECIQNNDTEVYQETTVVNETSGNVSITFESFKFSTKSEIKLKKIREVICINDMFLFKRELFGNDERLMNSIFSEIDRTSSFEEAENMLAERFGWDTEEDSFAADFMQKIANRFK